jgi:hypothetical protein
MFERTPASSTLEDKNMAKQTRTSANPQSNDNIQQQGMTSPEQREARIREIAHANYAKRGHTPGYELDDWLAAEAEYQNSTAESQEFPSDMDIQQSGVHSPSKDDRLKKFAKQHPKKAIPQIESMESEQAPFKE